MATVTPTVKKKTAVPLLVTEGVALEENWKTSALLHPTKDALKIKSALLLIIGVFVQHGSSNICIAVRP